MANASKTQTGGDTSDVAQSGGDADNQLDQQDRPPDFSIHASDLGTSEEKPGEGVQISLQSKSGGMEMAREEVAQRVGAEAAMRPEKSSEMEEAERRGYERAMAEMQKQKEKGKQTG